MTFQAQFSAHLHFLFTGIAFRDPYGRTIIFGVPILIIMVIEYTWGDTMTAVKLIRMALVFTGIYQSIIAMDVSGFTDINASWNTDPFRLCSLN